MGTYHKEAKRHGRVIINDDKKIMNRMCIMRGKNTFFGIAIGKPPSRCRYVVGLKELCMNQRFYQYAGVIFEASAGR